MKNQNIIIECVSKELGLVVANLLKSLKIEDTYNTLDTSSLYDIRILFGGIEGYSMEHKSYRNGGFNNYYTKVDNYIFYDAATQMGELIEDLTYVPIPERPGQIAKSIAGIDIIFSAFKAIKFSTNFGNLHFSKEHLEEMVKIQTHLDHSAEEYNLKYGKEPKSS